jgi:hypothetical protein
MCGCALAYMAGFVAGDELSEFSPVFYRRLPFDGVCSSDWWGGAIVGGVFRFLCVRLGPWKLL